MTAALESAAAHPASDDAPLADASAGRWPWVGMDRFLAPQAHRFGSDELRRARLALVISASIALLAAIATTNLALHGVWGNVPIAVGLVAVFALVPFLIRQSGSLVLAGHAMAGALATALAILKLNTGAATVPPFILLPGVPLLAALIAGPWPGFLWGGFAFVELGFFYLLASNGLEPTIELDPRHLFLGRYVGSAMMVFFVVLLAEAYERLKNLALDEVTDAHRLVEARSQELARTRREQLELKDRFLSHVSHELRTPLTALNQFLSLVLDGVTGKLEGEQREYLEMAFRNANQLGHMINDLMDLNRARNGKLRVDSYLFPPAPLLTETLRGLEGRVSEKRIRLERSIPDDLALVEGDATRLRQVLGNLVENAIKFTPEEGRIEVVAAPDPGDEAFLRISVRDTGCGIEQEAVERIFERLHQEQAAESASRLGLGLGLTIAKELVERQRGRIWAESEPGRGSTFHFTLPTFSLARAIRPTVTCEGQLRPFFSVVSIEVRSGSATSSDGMRRSILHLLRSTVFYPDRDVVLPPGASESAARRFVVLAATGSEGAKTLTKRLRVRLDRLAQERGFNDTVFRLNATTEKIPSALAHGPQDAALETLADRLEEILREAAHGGEEKCLAERS